MSSPIITVENLGKCYRIQHQSRERYTALRDVLTNKVKGLFRPQTSDLRPQTSEEDFWAIKDISFEIKQGDVVGIIGRNGAGKSTLLKILSRITEPTKGRVTLRGRVASLLEVGTGFHPELTGRENIFLNGAILGMTRAEIRSKFDEIVAFAEVEKFLDTPVKRYSSGMYVRLAFAVAAHLEPEILIVDEVLAVGDAEFQKKCLGKMQDVSRGGRTVLFVSHNMGAVNSLCSRAVLLQNGRIEASGTTGEITARYLSGSDNSRNGSTFIANPQDVRQGVSLLGVTVVRSNGCPANLLESGEPFCIKFSYRLHEPCRGVRVGYRVETTDGIVVFGSNDGELSEILMSERGSYETFCTIDHLKLNSGVYAVTVGVDLPPYEAALFLNHHCLRLEVEVTKGMVCRFARTPGVVRPSTQWTRPMPMAAAPRSGGPLNSPVATSV